MSLLLDVFYVVAAIAASPWLAYRLIARGDAAALYARFGAGLGAPVRGSIWLHGSSAGEISLLVPLVRLLEERGVEMPIVISAYSSTGIAAARKSFAHHKVVVFPVDLSFIVRRVFRCLDPKLIVVVESEFWPNFLLCARRRGVPVALINGKVSERSCRRYARTRFMSALLQVFSLLAVQSEVHARRFRSLSVSADRIHTTGNMKYDLAMQRIDFDERSRQRKALGFSQSETIIIGGSLHEREDAALIDAYRRVSHPTSGARLIIVPRYPVDCRRVAQLVSRAGFRPQLRSTLSSDSGTLASDAVLIVDTLGELRTMYAAADIAFVGGSLFYRGGSKGGHNLMEPAVFGLPVLFGPYHSSFADTAEALIRAGGGFEIANEQSLTAILRRLIDDRDYRNACGRQAIEIIEANRGATRRNLELLMPLVDAINV